MRGDPYERADHETEGYNVWRVERAYLVPIRPILAISFSGR